MVLGTLWLLGCQFRRCFPWGIHQFGVLSVLLMLGPTAGKFPQRWDVIKTTESRAIFRMDMGRGSTSRSYFGPCLRPSVGSMAVAGPAAGKRQQGSFTFSAACLQLAVAVLLRSQRRLILGFPITLN